MYDSYRSVNTLSWYCTVSSWLYIKMAAIMLYILLVLEDCEAKQWRIADMFDEKMSYQLNIFTFVPFILCFLLYFYTKSFLQTIYNNGFYEHTFCKSNIVPFLYNFNAFSMVIRQVYIVSKLESCLYDYYILLLNF